MIILGYILSEKEMCKLLQSLDTICFKSEKKIIYVYLREPLITETQIPLKISDKDRSRVGGVIGVFPSLFNTLV